MFDLSGKTAVVTGSTRGIGFDIAKTLAKCGAKVYITGVKSVDECKRASEQIENSVPVMVNLLEKDEIDKLYQTTGDVDILVHNASIQYKNKWNEFSEDEYDIQFNCNLKATYYLIKKYHPGMQKKKFGRIVTLGSVNQYNQHPELSLYGVTKAAQAKLVKNLAPIFAPDGITINNVAPGVISTLRNKEVLDNPETRKKIIDAIPCGFIGEPKDISPAVLLLRCEEGRYITGTEILIDGGMSL